MASTPAEGSTRTERTSHGSSPAAHAGPVPERTLRLASAGLRLVGDAASERQLLDGVCRLLTDEAGYALAWVGGVGRSPDEPVVPIAWSGDDDYVRGLEVCWRADHPLGHGPTGRAIREERPVAFNALSEDERFGPWLEAARAHRYEASCAVPLRVGDRVAVVLNVYARRHEAFDGAELSRLAELADAVARGLERFRAEDRLRHARDQLQAIFDASPDMIFVHGCDGRLLDVSARVEEVYGMSRETILAAPPERTIGGKHTYEEARGRIREALERGELRVDWMATRGDGSAFPVEVRLRRLARSRDEVPDDPTEPAVVAVVQDLTQRRRYEQQMMRSAKLESLSLLAGGVAHDFNNALSAVLGALSVASRELPAHATSRELVEDAIGAASSARSLTRQLMTFARDEAQEPTVFALGPMLQRTARLTLAGTPSVLRVELPPDLPPVRGDRDQLTQVFHNLFLNALQAMPDGGELWLTARPEPSGRVAVHVRDTGAGIPDEVLERIFDPFFTTKETGSGLGLPTALAVLERHAGRLDVRSTPGQGTTFVVRLPAAEAAPRERPNETPATGLRRLRVLILEDEDALRRVFVRLFEQLGHEAVAAPHGEAAVSACRRELEVGRGVDVALLDLTIRGGRGGAEIVPDLRALLPGRPIIAMSGYSERDPSGAGFDAFLPKPFTVDQLEEKLAELLPGTDR
ncbi:MAG TPA: ATP-binding protein [Sandaracinaceae bacterium LLY-WYZ-13_1]|nr:ATP-binding protein [Sandaracinaceae bacterium LLY-WYZ-13_1]